LGTELGESILASGEAIAFKKSGKGTANGVIGTGEPRFAMKH
jgi:hypothetical protein